VSDLPRRIAIALIRLYQMSLGRFLGGSCRFHPSCSEYAVLAIRADGVLAGGARSLWRLLRCGPWSAGGVDHPDRSAARRAA
jgi:hypothetical protein